MDVMQATIKGTVVNGYFVSRDGNVYSAAYGMPLRMIRNYRSGKRNSKYRAVTLSSKGKQYRVSLHRLVAEVFIGVCPNGMQVRHRDGNPGNNCAENLEYGTAAENAADRFRHGTQPFGETHHSAKLTAQQVEQIRLDISSGVRVKDVAAKFGIAERTASQIAKFERRKRG
jgi:hypothetical protein